MLRFLYCRLLRLHPRSFRDRFADEMLSIFDQAGVATTELRLIFDASLSLVRQWTLRQEFWNSSPVTPAPAVFGVPSFATLQSFRPRTAAVLHGLALSILLFCATCFAIRYSWIHVLHIQIPEFELDRSLPVSPASRTSLSRAIPKPIAPPNSPKEQQSVSEHLSVEVLPVEAKYGGSSPSATKLNSQSSGDRSPAKVVVVLELRLNNYAGKYKAQSSGITIKVAVHDHQLVMEFAGGPTRTLSPYSETTFGIEGSPDSRIEFVPGTDGRMREMHLLEHGEHVVAVRQ